MSHRWFLVLVAVICACSKDHRLGAYSEDAGKTDVASLGDYVGVDGSGGHAAGTGDTGPETRNDGGSGGNPDKPSSTTGIGGARLRLLAGGLSGTGESGGTATSARSVAPLAVASDGAGNLFVADSNGNAIRKLVVATGAITTLAGSPGASGSADGTGVAARFFGAKGLAYDGAGNLFVADSGNHTIRKVVIATGAVSTVAGSPGVAGSTDGTGGEARFSQPQGLVIDRAGNLFVADSRNGTIRVVVIATGTVTTLAGSPGTLGSTDGTGAAARFVRPSGVTSDGTGNLFVADSFSHTIRKVAIATGTVTTLAGSPGKLGSSDGTLAAARFNAPSGVASDGASIFVTDTVNSTIRRVVIATGEVFTLAGFPGQRSSADGTVATARFNRPVGVASDGVGNIFVTDGSSGTVRKVVIATGLVTTVAGLERGGSADGIGNAARFAGPGALALDGAGNLFVADSGNHTIRKVVIATGVVTTVAGSGSEDGNTDGTGADARFDTPWGLAVDGVGNLFVADRENFTIRKVRIATGAVTTLAGSPGYLGSVNGTGAAARFLVASGLASDGAGSLFVADSSNCTIRKVVVETGTVTSLAGSLLQEGSTDGTGVSARFLNPSAVASDGAGNLFVVDSGNQTIRKVVIATGTVTTLAGSPKKMGSDDGAGAAARFNSPTAVASDGGGNLFVADTGNHTLRKVVIATGVVTTVVGSPSREGVTPGPLPASLRKPQGLAVGPAGELYISDENAVLVAEF